MSTTIGALLIIASLHPSNGQFVSTSWMPSMEVCEAAKQVLLSRPPKPSVGWSDLPVFGWQDGEVNCYPLQPGAPK